MSDDHFLGRWSRRKSIARAGGSPPPEPLPPAPAAPAAEAAVTVPGAGDEPPPLPPVESLTAESDFAPFMRGGVDPQVRRDALKVLLRDPRFNVMDGLDVYIDDYSKPDPLPEGWLEKLNQVAFLGDATPAPAQEAAQKEQEEEGEEKPGDPMEHAPTEGAERLAQAPERAGEEASSNGASGAAFDTAPNDAS